MAEDGVCVGTAVAIGFVVGIRVAVGPVTCVAVGMDVCVAVGTGVFVEPLATCGVGDGEVKLDGVSLAAHEQTPISITPSRTSFPHKESDLSHDRSICFASPGLD